MDPIEIAWAAGFFDGEGTVGLTAGEFRLQVKQNATANGDVPDTLERFHRIVGVGRIGGPYVDRPTRLGFSERRRPSFMWYARRDEAIAAVLLLWPQLGDAKRAAALPFLTDSRAIA